MWVLPYWKDLSKMISRYFPKIWERENTSHPSKDKKRLLKDFKSGTAEWEIVFPMKNSSHLKLLLNSELKSLRKSSAVIDESVRTFYRQQKSFSFMVLVLVSKSWKSPLKFVDQGVTINTELYINNILVPAFEKNEIFFKDQRFTFQQDRVPSHTSIKTQDWYKRHFPRFWNKEKSPASPDLNPMDVSLRYLRLLIQVFILWRHLFW